MSKYIETRDPNYPYTDNDIDDCCAELIAYHEAIWHPLSEEWLQLKTRENKIRDEIVQILDILEGDDNE